MSFRLTDGSFVINKAALLHTYRPRGQQQQQHHGCCAVGSSGISVCNNAKKRHFDPVLVCLCKDSTAKVANYKIADPGGRAVWSVRLRPHACWGLGFESFRGHGCLYLVNVVWCRAHLRDGPKNSSSGLIPNACVNEGHQVQQQPPTPTMSRYKRSA